MKKEAADTIKGKVEEFARFLSLQRSTATSVRHGVFSVVYVEDRPAFVVSRHAQKIHTHPVGKNSAVASLRAMHEYDWTQAHVVRREDFSALARQYEKETLFYSTRHSMVHASAYAKLVALGAPAVPKIIQRLRYHPSLAWIIVLEAITGERHYRPVRAHGFEQWNVEEAVAAWCREGE